MVGSTFSENPYWRPSYAPPISELLTEIPGKYQRVKEFTENHVEFAKGYCENYRAIYITECNCGERTGTQTLGETERALESDNKKPLDRNSLKTKNLLEAIEFIFGKKFITSELEHDFDPMLAKKVNKLIGDGLFEGGGYRKTGAKPAGYDYQYREPVYIEEEMNSLFKKVKQWNVNENNWYEVAAFFIATFLYIHPFYNGNGRTARLLTSALLREYSLIPVSLYNRDRNLKSNEVYLHCLHEAQINRNPTLLRSLIIECTHRTLDDFIWSCDIGNPYTMAAMQGLSDQKEECKEEKRSWICPNISAGGRKAADSTKCPP